MVKFPLCMHTSAHPDNPHKVSVRCSAVSLCGTGPWGIKLIRTPPHRRERPEPVSASRRWANCGCRLGATPLNILLVDLDVRLGEHLAHKLQCINAAALIAIELFEQLNDMLLRHADIISFRSSQNSSS